MFGFDPQRTSSPFQNASLNLYDVVPMKAPCNRQVFKRMTFATSHTNPFAGLSRSTARLWLAVFIIVFSISFSTAHTTLNMLGETGWGDSSHYLSSYYGKEIWGHWRYRILTI